MYIRSTERHVGVAHLVFTLIIYYGVFMLSGSLPSSRSGHTFAKAPQAEIQRSKLDRTSTLKTTFDAGYLIPIFVDEALPGDTFNLNMTSFSRLTTPKVPIMDNLHFETFFFAVPLRLIWSNFEKFCGAQEDPGDSTDYLVPTMTSPVSTGYQNSSIHDYLGIPPQVPSLEHSSLWHRAYNLIFNEWFRDQNLQNSLPVPKGDGPDSPSDFALVRRGKRHDYFTSCLPAPQKGPAVEIPIGDFAPVVSEGTGYPLFNTAANPVARSLSTLSSSPSITVTGGVPSATEALRWVTPRLQADLSTATAVTINQLRQAVQIQRLFERDMRGGTRYTEITRSHFGVTSPDARLQRPEYLGGGYSPIVISPIAQTSSTDGTSPQGNLAAFGTCLGKGHGFTKSFTEHCVILGLACVRADLTYQQGLPRMFSRQTRWDFYWPALSHLGEQAVLNRELFAQGGPDDGENPDYAVFGYQERFAEYRYKQSMITGQYRSSFAQSLDMWHLSQDFQNLPTLNADFIEERPPLARTLAVQNYPHFFFDAYFKLVCARPMPVYSVPGMMDHF